MEMAQSGTQDLKLSKEQQPIKKKVAAFLHSCSLLCELSFILVTRTGSE